MLDSLQRHLVDMPPLAVAVSGGVDSMTLAAAAHRATRNALLVHATSPAVPAEATRRVREWADRAGAHLEVIDAGEFADPRYRANPVNRCFFCKTNLYASIRAITDRQIVSGANLDDLAEYRPGLEAAAAHAVRHPYVEQGIDKKTVRAIAAALGLGAIADLPASPCLSSRVETGIAVEPRMLRMIHAVEGRISAALAPRTVRCRVRASGLVIELDGAALARITDAPPEELIDDIRALQAAAGLDGLDVRFAPYRTGSAFLVVRA